MARRTSYPILRRDLEMERLERDLSRAQMVIMDLMPDRFRRVLSSYVHCETERDLYGWSYKAAEALVELCDPIQPPLLDGYPLDSPRAPCPLCGAVPTTIGAVGYALPEGLLRHLQGTHNVWQCGVFWVAESKARQRRHDMAAGRVWAVPRPKLNEATVGSSKGPAGKKEER